MYGFLLKFGRCFTWSFTLIYATKPWCMSVRGFFNIRQVSYYCCYLTFILYLFNIMYTSRTEGNNNNYSACKAGARHYHASLMNSCPPCSPFTCPPFRVPRDTNYRMTSLLQELCPGTKMAVKVDRNVKPRA